MIAVPPTARARSRPPKWYGRRRALIVLLRSKRPDAEIALCFASFGTYERSIQGTHQSLSDLGVGVYLVQEGGAIERAVRTGFGRSRRRRPTTQRTGPRRCRMTGDLLRASVAMAPHGTWRPFAKLSTTSKQNLSSSDWRPTRCGPMWTGRGTSCAGSMVTFIREGPTREALAIWWPPGPGCERIGD